MKSILPLIALSFIIASTAQAQDSRPTPDAPAEVQINRLPADQPAPVQEMPEDPAYVAQKIERAQAAARVRLRDVLTAKSKETNPQNCFIDLRQTIQRDDPYQIFVQNAQKENYLLPFVYLDNFLDEPWAKDICDKMKPVKLIVTHLPKGLERKDPQMFAVAVQLARQDFDTIVRSQRGQDVPAP